MKVACVGGGPASLYFSILMKRVDPSHDITVYERNPAGATYGWGVTYWEELLENLYRADPESAGVIAANSVHWTEWKAQVHEHPPLMIDHWDDGFGIGRREMLDILTRRARSLGVRVRFEREIAHEDELRDADLVVAGDGVNSALRDRHAGHFGTEVVVGRNMYMWLGTTKVFDAFTFAFADTPHGWIWCYGYGFSKTHSTCVVECAPRTWRGLGLDQTNEADSLALLEKLFADTLDGHALIGREQQADVIGPDQQGSALGPDQQADGAHWLNFRTVTNRTWHRGNLVLIGDAAHTTHYSIGAGTALALGDAAYLVDALHEEPDLETALGLYERERMDAIRNSQKAARYSARWYENLPRYVGLPPRKMMTLLGQRHSPVLAYMPPRLYYGMGWLGSRVTRALPLGRR